MGSRPSRLDLTSASRSRSVPDRALAKPQTGERTGSRPSAAEGGGAQVPALRPADHRSTSQHSCSFGCGMAGKIRLISLLKKQNIFEELLDAPERIESARQISFSAQPILSAQMRCGKPHHHATRKLICPTGKSVRAQLSQRPTAHAASPAPLRSPALPHRRSAVNSSGRVHCRRVPGSPV
jgi:hypothetical protein